MPESTFFNQNIQNFYEAAKRKDFARINLFRVTLIESNVGIRFDESDLVYIKSTSVPKRAIKNNTLPFMGVSFNIPGTANYPGSESWSVTFRIPQDLSIRTKFENWTRAIFDDQTSTGAYSTSNLGTVEMALLDKAGKPLRQYKLIGVYCTSLGDSNLDITDGGGIVELPVTLAYQYWEIK